MALQEHTIQEINLDEIIRNKAGRKAKYIPQFVINLLKRIIHQEFINIYFDIGRHLCNYRIIHSMYLVVVLAYIIR